MRPHSSPAASLRRPVQRCPKACDTAHRPMSDTSAVSCSRSPLASLTMTSIPTPSGSKRRPAPLYSRWAWCGCRYPPSELRMTGAGVVLEEQVGIEVAVVAGALHIVDARLLVLAKNTFGRARRSLRQRTGVGEVDE